MLSTKHKQVYYTARCCQAASLFLTSSRVRGLFWASPVENKKTAGFSVRPEWMKCVQRQLRGFASILLLSSLKSAPLITRMFAPDNVDVGWEADKVPYQSFFDFLPPNLTCVFRRIQLSSIAASPSIRELYVHQLDVLSSQGMPVLDIHMTRSTEDQDLAFLSSRRGSHVYAYEMLSTVRCPFVLCQAHCLLLAGEGVRLVVSSLTYFPVRIIGELFQRRRFRNATTDVGFVEQNLNSTNSVSPYVQDLRNRDIRSFCQLPLYQHAPVPFGFRRQVSCHPRGYLPSTSPALRRNFIGADMAHDAYLHICQGADSHTVTFALSSLAFVIHQRPGFLSSRLPSELMRHIAQWLQASIALMGFGVIVTLERNRSRPSQDWDACATAVARAVIAPFCKQSRSKPLACSQKTAEDLIVVMSQKKGADLLVIGGDLLKERQELSHQRPHQLRLGPGGNRIGVQKRLMQRLKNLWGDLRRIGMTCLLEDRGDLLSRGRAGCTRGKIGLQEEQCRTLLQLAKQAQSGWIIGFEAGSQLIDQAGPIDNQRILVTSQGFEFLDNGTIGSQFPQVSQITSSRFCQKIGINQVCFGSRSVTAAIYSFGIDRIECASFFQQCRDEQPLMGFDNARNLIERGDSTQERGQLAQPFSCVGKVSRGDLVASINHHKITIGVCPIQSGIPHTMTPFSNEGYSGPLCSCTQGSEHDPLMINLVQEHAREERSCSIGRVVRRKLPFPGRPHEACIPLLGPSSRGLSFSLTYKEV